MKNPDLTRQREQMVEYQLVSRGITDEKVLNALKSVPRHEFVPENLKDRAYQDSALPIEDGQTISQPFIVGQMIEALNIGEDDRVLDVGTGSGYAAAVLSYIADEVYTIEFIEELAYQAQLRFRELGYDNISVKIGDGAKGWVEKAPFTGILVSACAPEIPEPLVDQLKDGGRLVIPVGERDRVQRLYRLTKKKRDDLEMEDLGLVRFVPLVSNRS